MRTYTENARQYHSDLLDIRLAMILQTFVKVDEQIKFIYPMDFIEGKVEVETQLKLLHVSERPQFVLSRHNPPGLVYIVGGPTMFMHRREYNSTPGMSGILLSRAHVGWSRGQSQLDAHSNPAGFIYSSHYYYSSSFESSRGRGTNRRATPSATNLSLTDSVKLGCSPSTR